MAATKNQIPAVDAEVLRYAGILGHTVVIVCNESAADKSRTAVLLASERADAFRHMAEYQESGREPVIYQRTAQRTWRKVAWS